MHPHSEILWPASLPFSFSFFLLMSLWWENHKCYYCSMICHQNDPSLSSTRGTINKTCILDPINFGGWPKCLKWSSQSRPMTDLVRKVVPKRQINHHYFWVWLQSEVCRQIDWATAHCCEVEGRWNTASHRTRLVIELGCWALFGMLCPSEMGKHPKY